MARDMDNPDDKREIEFENGQPVHADDEEDDEDGGE